MDDTKDKIRRNLIAFAALIVVIPFWGLKIENDFNLWGLKIDGSIDPFKIWFTITVVLVYFFLRYRFDANAIEESKKLRSEFVEIQRSFITPILSKEMVRYIRFGEKPHYILNPDAYTEHLFDKEFIANKSDIKKIKVTGYIHHNNPTLWENVVGFSVEGIREAQGKFASSGGNGCDYRLSKTKVAVLFLQSMLKMTTYSGSGINFILPFVLFYCAWGYCWFRMSSILLMS